MKWIGAVLILGGCVAVAYRKTCQERRERRCLKEFVRILDWIEWELDTRMWALPELFQKISQQTSDCWKRTLEELSARLAQNSEPDAAGCVERVLEECPILPASSTQLLRQLGRSLGQFALDGQCQQIRQIRIEAERILEEDAVAYRQRQRDRWILSLCAGAALVILFG